MAARVYITGAAGSGTSSLGHALAEKLGVPLLDTDDFYWAETETPFTVKRPVAERLAMITEAEAAEGPEGGWVLAGSADGWGEAAVEGVDLIVFLRTPMPVRLARIRRREAAKFGSRIKPGGDMYRNHREFLAWATAYDDPYFRGRSLQRHLDWLGGRAEPVLQLQGTRPIDELAVACLSRLNELRQH